MEAEFNITYHPKNKILYYYLDIWGHCFMYYENINPKRLFLLCSMPSNRGPLGYDKQTDTIYVVRNNKEFVLDDITQKYRTWRDEQKANWVTDND